MSLDYKDFVNKKLAFDVAILRIAKLLDIDNRHNSSIAVIDYRYIDYNYCSVDYYDKKFDDESYDTVYIPSFLFRKSDEEIIKYAKVEKHKKRLEELEKERKRIEKQLEEAKHMLKEFQKKKYETS